MSFMSVSFMLGCHVSAPRSAHSLNHYSHSLNHYSYHSITIQIYRRWRGHCPHLVTPHPVTHLLFRPREVHLHRYREKNVSRGWGLREPSKLATCLICVFACVLCVFVHCAVTADAHTAYTRSVYTRVERHAHT